MKFTTHPSTRLALLFPLALLIAGELGKNVQHSQMEISKQETSLNFNADLLHLMSVGFNATLADLIWVQTLLESDIEHYKGKSLDSWLFHRFNLISKLDPNFYENYLYGGQYLMIVKDDLDGAEHLMERGLQYFSEDMSLNWQLGFLWAYERHDFAKAYPYFKKVSVNPKRPPMFDSIFARLSSETMGPQEAYSFIHELWNQHPKDSPIKLRLGQILYSLKARVDLECLNSLRQDCQRQDFEGNDYINEKGVWTASKPLQRTDLRIRKERATP